MLEEHQPCPGGVHAGQGHGALLEDLQPEEWLRLSRWGAAAASHSGSSFATVRANSWDVSTSSNAITQAGGFFASADEG
jgi:hypothetical protein